MATVFLLLASLIAAAGFAVVAQRRLRQLGMLAAIGATQKHLRLVLVTNGAIVGAIAAACGTIVGLALWLASARCSKPPSTIASTGSACHGDCSRRPSCSPSSGRAPPLGGPRERLPRVPVMLALSGRPPEPRPARHAAIAAVALIALGILCLAVSERERPPLIIAGILATILGTLLLGPPAIRIFSGVAGRLPVAPRLALRDLVRYQARSGAALAAVTLALGIAATVVVVASAEEAERPPSRRTCPTGRSACTWARRSSQATPRSSRWPTSSGSPPAYSQLAGGLDRATVIALHKAFQPGETALVVGDTRVRPTIDLSRRVDRRLWRPESQLYVGTPAVLKYLGIAPAVVAPGTDFLADPSVPTDRLVIPPRLAELRGSRRHQPPAGRDRPTPLRQPLG